MTDRKMYRYVVPVDDKPHVVTLTGDPVAVAAGDTPLPGAFAPVVEFWAEFDPAKGGTDRVFQVFGTGQPLPVSAVWAGTRPRTPLGLVWHLFELKEPTP